MVYHPLSDSPDNKAQDTGIMGWLWQSPREPNTRDLPLPTNPFQKEWKSTRESPRDKPLCTCEYCLREGSSILRSSLIPHKSDHSKTPENLSKHPEQKPEKVVKEKRRYRRARTPQKRSYSVILVPSNDAQEEQDSEDFLHRHRISSIGGGGTELELKELSPRSQSPHSQVSDEEGSTDAGHASSDTSSPASNPAPSPAHSPHLLPVPPGGQLHADEDDLPDCGDFPFEIPFEMTGFETPKHSNRHMI